MLRKQEATYNRSVGRKTAGPFGEMSETVLRQMVEFQSKSSRSGLSKSGFVGVFSTLRITNSRENFGRSNTE